MLQDDLWRETKKRAAERNMTVSDFVNETLRAALVRTPDQAPPFELITFGRSGRRVRNEPLDFHAADDAEDRDRLR